MTGPATPEETARRTLLRSVLLPSWAFTLLLISLYVAGLSIPAWLQYVPFAVSLLFLGLPHGAVDHLVPGRLSGSGASFKSILGVVALYLVLASLYLALWFTVPVVAFALFIALTWFHWGQGDLYSLLALSRAEYLRSPLLRPLTVFVRGGLPMLVPLLAFPEVYRGIANNITGLFIPGGIGDISFVFGPAFRTFAALCYAALVLFTLTLGYLRSGKAGRKPFFLDAVETAMLAVYFSLVPPILAVGVYFSLWHALRHVARLMLINEVSDSDLRRGRALAAFKVFFRDAAPLTLMALVILVGLYFVVPGNVSGPDTLLALYLALISLLTLPHVVIVCFMDRRQRIWKW